MKFLCYAKCSTCQKASKWLNDHGVSFTSRCIKSDNPRPDELIAWFRKSGLPLKRFFNTSGQAYRELGLAGKLDEMSEAQQIALLATNGMLLRRPILVSDDFVLVGFKEAEWNEALNV